MKKFLQAILIANLFLWGAVACGDQPFEGTVVEKEHEPAEWDCLKRDTKGNCKQSEWDDEDCTLKIKPPKEANETDERYAKVEPVEIEVACNAAFHKIKVGDYWSR